MGVVSVHRGQLTLRDLGVQGGETPGPRAIREGFRRTAALNLTSKAEQVRNKQRGRGRHSVEEDMTWTKLSIEATRAGGFLKCRDGRRVAVLLPFLPSHPRQT